MCYFLYGAINAGIDTLEYENALCGSQFSFKIGNKDDVKKSVEENGDFVVTKNMCDCRTALGSRKLISKEYDDFLRLIKRLSKVSGIQYIYICKNNDGDSIEKESYIYYEDLDNKYLADMEDNCLYFIDLKKKYY